MSDIELTEADDVADRLNAENRALRAEVEVLKGLDSYAAKKIEYLRSQLSARDAEVRALRKPEPYKGKGVRYEGEVVRRKAGKAGKK